MKVVWIASDVSEPVQGRIGDSKSSFERTEDLCQGAATGESETSPGSHDVHGELLQRPSRSHSYILALHECTVYMREREREMYITGIMYHV